MIFSGSSLSSQLKSPWPFYLVVNNHTGAEGTVLAACVCVWPWRVLPGVGKPLTRLTPRTQISLWLLMWFPQGSAGEGGLQWGPESWMLAHVSCLIFIIRRACLIEATWYCLSPTKEAADMARKAPHQKVSLILVPGDPPTLDTCPHTADRREQAWVCPGQTRGQCTGALRHDRFWGAQSDFLKKRGVCSKINPQINSYISFCLAFIHILGHHIINRPLMNISVWDKKW